jgi:DegV family protein with EDD domain
MDGEDYLDQIDITPAEFWQVFGTLKEIPTTGVPGPGVLASIFSELAESTDSIMCTHVSMAVSAIYESFKVARETVMKEHPHLKIEYVDSKSSSGALGLIALEAARAAQAGKSLSEVVKIAQDMVPRVKWIMAVDTLKYLIKGGRAPKTAIVGEVLGVKPIIGFVDDTGLIVSLGKERGKKKAMLKLVDMVKDYADVSKPLHIIVHYTNHIEDSVELKEMVTSRYNCAEVYVSDLTPVMTAHTGPAVSLSFYSEL